MKEKITEDHIRQISARSEYFIDQFNHEEHIRERLTFIVEFYKMYSIKLEPEKLKVLWRLLSSEAPCRINYEVFFEWMNSQVNALDTQQYSVLTGESVEKFFTDFLISSQNSYTNLENEGFSLIKNLFKLINEKEHKIQILNSSQAKKDHGTISSACGSTLTS